jgi:PadR family transcriptional regulator, regulatory protein AphA
MSLRHAILGVLSATPMTGYDLDRYFNDSVGDVWPAPQSQIYPELRKMEEHGLISSTLAPRGQRAAKRVYAIAEAGQTELLRWVAEFTPYPPERDAFHLKAVFFDMAPPEVARAQLRAHREHYSRLLQQWQAHASAIRQGHHGLTLLHKRLAGRDPREHDTILQLKAFAYEGHAARARAEVEWADSGLELLDQIDTYQAHATGSRGDSAPVGGDR